ncbi:MAG: LysM peptidoglycan-binding domain-containing protein, partial [Thermodesulfovibrionales bacterium]|nr:LysM peptidoglycan-binding domain-containing protein [Thermodesulfovibrionales bacterium]
MIKKISLIGMLAFMVIAFSFLTSSGQDMDYKEYKVLKGDTLWDISSKEIKDPFLWPKIWKENPDIKNPDRISPSQMIKIPLRLIQKEQAEEAATEKASAIQEPAKIESAKEEPKKLAEKKIEPVKKNYLADENLILSSGYITDYISKEIKSVGKVTGSPSGQTLFGNDDFIDIKANSNANTGEKFYIIRPIGMIRHPQTDKKIGHFIALVGIAEVIGMENGFTKAKITKAYGDIRVGDLLDTFHEVEPIIETDAPRKPAVSGFIIAAHQQVTITGAMDIVFIDKGSNDSLELGDILKTT